MKSRLPGQVGLKVSLSYLSNDAITMSAIDASSRLPPLSAKEVKMLFSSKIAPGHQVLELGCGSHQFTSVLHQLVGDTGSVHKCHGAHCHCDFDRFGPVVEVQATHSLLEVDFSYRRTATFRGADVVIYHASPRTFHEARLVNALKTFKQYLAIGGVLVIQLCASTNDRAAVERGGHVAAAAEDLRLDEVNGIPKDEDFPTTNTDIKLLIRSVSAMARSLSPSIAKTQMIAASLHMTNVFFRERRTARSRGQRGNGGAIAADVLLEVGGGPWIGTFHSL